MTPFETGRFSSRWMCACAVQINTSTDCNRSDSQNPFCKSNVDVSNFLNLNSLSNHDLYCLAYVFTYRDFSQGTLGLAWVGSSLSQLYPQHFFTLFVVSIIDTQSAAKTFLLFPKTFL